MCRANGLDPAATLADEDLACWLICRWYVAHIDAGGEPDDAVKRIMTEIAAAQESGIAALQLGGSRSH
jgi:hypothetical protein